MCGITDLQSAAINQLCHYLYIVFKMNTLGLEPKINRLKADCFTN